VQVEFVDGHVRMTLLLLLLLLLQVEVEGGGVGVQAGVLIAPPLLEQVLVVVVKVAWLYVVGVTINSEMGEYEGDQVLLLLPALRLTTLTTLLLSVV